MSINSNLKSILKTLDGYKCTLIAVSKNHPASSVLEAYQAGQRDFGENKVQEMTDKMQTLPLEIKWHMIGHLQRNKVKYIAPYVHLIHSVDSLKLLQEINKEALKQERIINCLLQIHIASEETKFGLSFEEVEDLLESQEFKGLVNIKITGLMGMASNTKNQDLVRNEFKQLKSLFDTLKAKYNKENIDMQDLSMGMSGDATIALEEGSTMIRIGTAIFGTRVY